MFYKEFGPSKENQLSFLYSQQLLIKSTLNPTANFVTETHWQHNKTLAYQSKYIGQSFHELMLVEPIVKSKNTLLSKNSNLCV